MSSEQWLQRTELLLGWERIWRLRQAQVTVAGIGGVGSYVVEALARLGVGKLRLVDADVYEPSNINRQLGALHSTLGKPKVQVAAARVQDINPTCQVTTERTFLNEGNCARVLGAQNDYVVDAIDSVDSKVALIMHCLRRDIPVISVMGTGNRLDPSRFAITDISKTHTCPLARSVRRRLRERGVSKGLVVVFSDEPPLRTGPGPGPVGSVSFVPAAAGLMAAGHVGRSIAGL